MKAFLSHSSADRDFVQRVYDALESQTAWIDRAEIEWGDVFLERIEEGIKTASDFVLFWSKHSAVSEWVKLETNMAFIELMNRRAIRLRIVRLDETELPLRLQPFHYLSVAKSENPLEEAISALRGALSQPTQGVRHRFLNRNSELGRIEDLINDTETRIVLLHGFLGIGKGALANEAFRRFFEGASVVEVSVYPGMGSTELALHLHHKAFSAVLPEVSRTEALAAIESAITKIIKQQQFLVFRNVNHWLDGERNLQEPLLTIIRQAMSLEETTRQPIILTSTKFPRMPIDLSRCMSNIRVDGLTNDHVTALVSLWFELSKGERLEHNKLSQISSHLHGHPVAAKVASSLIGQFGVEHLLAYPRELVNLRRDLAKALIGDLVLSSATANLMEMLALIGVPLPSKVLVDILSLDEETFQDAVSSATGAGIAETTDSGYLTLHPLIADHFWRTHLDHDDYRERAANAATIVRQYFDGLPTDSVSFVSLLPSVFRLYVLSDNLEEGRKIRSDLRGELAQAAITHYNRRQYAVAETFISEILEGDPANWSMRQYLTRIRIRQRRWNEADELIETLLFERPYDIGMKHVRGWRLLREQRFDEALKIFAEVLAARTDHVASLRHAAECLYRLDRIPEALEFLERSKQIESDNPYTLDLEARIYEETKDFERALLAAGLAVVRNPKDWGLRHRRARILSALGRSTEAVTEAVEAVRIGPEQFTARSTLVSLLLDEGQFAEALQHIEALGNQAINAHERHISVHLNARCLYMSGNLEGALEMVEQQVRRRVNLAPSYGLLAQIRLAQYARMTDRSSASAQILLEQAKSAVANCEAQKDHDPNIVNELWNRIRYFESLS